MTIFHSYVKLPEGIFQQYSNVQNGDERFPKVQSSRNLAIQQFLDEKEPGTNK